MRDTSAFSMVLLGSGALSLALTPLVIRGANRAGMIDKPDARKVHTRLVPRGGGLAIAVAAAVSLVALVLAAPQLFGTTYDDWLRLGGVAAAAAIIFLIGLCDDLRGLSGSVKLVALLSAATIATSAGARLDTLSFFGTHPVALGALGWPLTILWIVGVAVTVNFMDGLDGLAGGLVGAAAAAITAAAVLHGQTTAALAGFALLGGLGGFLVYNVHPAKIFMGDSGSLFIGCLVACLPLLESRDPSAAAPAAASLPGPGVLMVPALFALSVPFVDGALTMVRRRVLLRRSIFAAERGHLHHRLLDRGFSHRNAVTLIVAASAGVAGLGLVATLGHAPLARAAALLAAVGVVALFHFAGSTRVKETLAALRNGRLLAQERRRCQKVFDEMQLRFRQTHTFTDWWAWVSDAADSAGFSSVVLHVPSRDGTTHALRWTSASNNANGHPHLAHTGANGHSTDASANGTNLVRSTVPVRGRRAGEILLAEVALPPGPALETAGYRVALFLRLMSEHSPVHLPPPARPATPRVRIVEPVPIGAVNGVLADDTGAPIPPA